MSGAGRIKDDGHDDDFVYEVKDTSKNTYSLDSRLLLELHKRAVRQGRQSKWVIKFSNNGVTAEVTVTVERQ